MKLHENHTICNVCTCNRFFVGKYEIRSLVSHLKRLLPLNIEQVADIFLYMTKQFY